MKNLNKILTKEFLVKEYIINKKSMLQIAKEVGCSFIPIRCRLIKYNIPMRNLKEAIQLLDRKGKRNSNFKNGFTLKRYYCKCGKEIVYRSTRCDECKNKLHSKKMIGKYNPSWQGGKTPLSDGIRNLFESHQWRKQIFERDNFTCQHCGDNKGHNLNAHHKEPFVIIFNNFLKKYDQFSPIEDKETLIRLAMKYKPFWNIDNGKTLCEDCHKKEHSKKVKSKEKVYVNN